MKNNIDIYSFAKPASDNKYGIWDKEGDCFVILQSGSSRWRTSGVAATAFASAVKRNKKRLYWRNYSKDDHRYNNKIKDHPRFEIREL